MSDEDLRNAAKGRGLLVANGRVLSRRETVTTALRELVTRGAVREPSFREKIRAAKSEGEIVRLLAVLKGTSAKGKTIRKAEFEAAKRLARLGVE